MKMKGREGEGERESQQEIKGREINASISSSAAKHSSALWYHVRATVTSSF